jgi:hypothetical protein
MFARIGVMKALNRNAVRKFDSSRKRHAAVERSPGAIGLFRIKMQHHSCDAAPVGTVRVRVAPTPR